MFSMTNPLNGARSAFVSSTWKCLAKEGARLCAHSPVTVIPRQQGKTQNKAFSDLLPVGRNRLLLKLRFGRFSPILHSPFVGPDLSSESATAHGGTGPRGVGSSRLVLGRFSLSKIGVKNPQVSQGPNQGWGRGISGRAWQPIKKMRKKMMVPCTMWECTSSGLMQPLSEALVVATTNSMKVLRARRPNIVSLTSRNCPIVFHTSVHDWHVLGRNTLALLQSTIHPTTKKQHFLKKNDCLPYHFSSPTRFPGCWYGSPSSLHQGNILWIPSLRSRTPSSQELQDWHFQGNKRGFHTFASWRHWRQQMHSGQLPINIEVGCCFVVVNFQASSETPGNPRVFPVL